jgi:hypothetical protein
MDAPLTDSPLTDSDARSLVARLTALDDELEPRERQLLRAMLTAALDPLDHRRYFGPELTGDQLAVIERLEAQRGRPDAATQPAP